MIAEIIGPLSALCRFLFLPLTRLHDRYDQDGYISRRFDGVVRTICTRSTDIDSLKVISTLLPHILYL